MPTTDLPIPIEIPWKLASTTQHLQVGYPEDTTVSLFYYEPDSENLQSNYPDERLIYFKFTVSVSPCYLLGSRARELPLSMLQGGFPVIHMVLDIGIVPRPFREGGFRPYFHAASPVRRSMVETGVVGESFFEGDSESISVGKSASSLHETASSKVSTKSKSIGGALPGIFGGGRRSSTTTMEGDRTLDQFTETTNREASEERRELLSHHTNIENILSLLHVKHIGSPYLRFTLSPRPLRQLTIDPTDPNLWYQQLIQHRSSGIEGIQEFFAVAAVPRNSAFCIQSSLRRFCVVDYMPTPPFISKKWKSSPTDAEVAPVIDYLFQKYPKGTPLDELDIDVLDSIDEDNTRIPSLALWDVHRTWMGNERVNHNLIVGYGDSWYPKSGFIMSDFFKFPYKTFDEAHLDMRMDEYYRELATSPLERGVVISIRKNLTTCFARDASGATTRISDSRETPPPGIVSFKHRLQYSAAVSEHTRSQFMQPPSAVVTSWNNLHEQIVQRIGELQKEDEQNFDFNHPKVVQVFLRYWAKLPEDHSDNLSLDKVKTIFKLNPALLRKFKETKVKDLKGFASLILAAPLLEKQNSTLENLLANLDKKQKCKFEMEDLKPIASPVSPTEITEICDHIGKSLQKEYVKSSNDRPGKKRSAQEKKSQSY